MWIYFGVINMNKRLEDPLEDADLLLPIIMGHVRAI